MACIYLSTAISTLFLNRPLSTDCLRLADSKAARFVQAVVRDLTEKEFVKHRLLLNYD
jgi:hypothetical protein